MQKFISKNKIRLIILIILILGITFFSLSVASKHNITPTMDSVNTQTAISSSSLKNGIQIKTINSVTEKKENTKNIPVNTQSATILIGDTTNHLSFAPNTVFYDALMQAKNADKIEFSGRNYLGLGFFVTDIGTLHSGNGKSLIYYINGKEATVGVSSYILKNGDIIEWKLE